MINNEEITELLINGPIICFRLEGMINNIQKVIYLFGDYNVILSGETSCPQYKSEDFVKYFVETMKKTDKNKKYDLFFEILSISNESNYTKVEEYIFEFSKYFKSTINVIKPNKLNKNNNDSKSKTSPNLKLHNINIKDIFTNKYIYVWINKLQILLSEISDNKNITLIQKIMYEKIVSNIKKNIVKTTQYLKKNFYETDQINEDNKNDKIAMEKIKKYSHKILYEYKNKNVENILTSQVEFLTKISKYVDKILMLIDKLTEYIYELYKILVEESDIMYENKYDAGYGQHDLLTGKIILKIEEIYTEIFNIYRAIFILITDLNSLRKFLDRDDITNCVCYMDIDNTFNYLFVLVKYFDFKITHATYTLINTSEIEKLIKKNEHDMKLVTEFFPQKIFQCINMIDFPKSFL